MVVGGGRYRVGFAFLIRFRSDSFVFPHTPTSCQINACSRHGFITGHIVHMVLACLSQCLLFCSGCG